MGGLILLTDVGLDLDDAPRQPDAIYQAHQPLPQQITGNDKRVAGEESAAELCCLS